jgi:hypothetical protein
MPAQVRVVRTRGPSRGRPPRERLTGVSAAVDGVDGAAARGAEGR